MSEQSKRVGNRVATVVNGSNFGRLLAAVSVAGLGVVWACATGTIDDVGTSPADGGVVPFDGAAIDGAGAPSSTNAADASPVTSEDASGNVAPGEDASPILEDTGSPVTTNDASSSGGGDDAATSGDDAGERDAGQDAGTTHDAGADAGMDAGTDAGASRDAGIDAGSTQDAGCSPASVVINEVQTAGTGGAEDEWVELYNPSSCAVSIAGWVLKHTSTTGTTADTVWTASSGVTLPAGGYGVVAGTAYSDSATPIGSFTSGVLAPDGGGLGLYYAATLIDSMGYGTGATNPFVQIAPAPAPPSAESAARTPNGATSHDNATDFAVATTPTPGARN